MKNVLILLMLLEVGSMKLFSQDTLSVKVIYSQQYTGLTNLIGPPINFTNFSYKNKPTLGSSLTVLFQNALSKRWGICYGVSYANINKRYHLNVDFLAQEYDGVVLLRYLKIPLMPQYYVLNRPKSRLYITGGLNVNMIIREKGAFPVFLETDNVADLFDLHEVGGYYSQFSADVAAGIGYEIKLHKRLYWVHSLHADYSITNVRSKYKGFINYNGLAQFYNRVSVPSHSYSIGYTFAALRYILR